MIEKIDNYLNDYDKLKCALCDITDRQISYYLSAAKYLNLICVVDGKREYTPKAKRIRKQNSFIQTTEIIALMLNDIVISKVYAYTIMFGRQEVEDVIEFIKEEYPNYSDAIYLRRAQTVISWIDWIISNSKDAN